MEENMELFFFFFLDRFCNNAPLAVAAIVKSAGIIYSPHLNLINGALFIVKPHYLNQHNL